MTHPSEHLLSAYYDGELSPAECNAIAAHLAECKACESILHDFASITETLTAAAFAEPTIAVQAQWLRSFRPAKQQGVERGVRQLAGLLAAAAAIVIAVSVAIPSEAQATSAPAEWEIASVTGTADVAATPQATAQWIVVDLSAGNGGAK